MYRLNDLTLAIGNDSKPMALTIGVVAAILSKRVETARLPISWLYRHILPAVTHRQVKFFYNSRGEPSSFVTWAFLSPETEARIAACQTIDLHFSEWCEGQSLWIVDCVSNAVSLRHLMRDLSENELKSYDSANYCRISSGMFFIKNLKFR